MPTSWSTTTLWTPIEPLLPKRRRRNRRYAGRKPDPGSRGVDGDPVRAAQRGAVEHAAARDGLRLRHDLLASPGALATRRRLEAPARRPAGRIAPAGPVRSGAGRRRQRLPPRAARGEKTGPNPTDRRKAGSKHHVLTDAHGIPLVASLTAANRHDITQLLPLGRRPAAAAGRVPAGRSRKPALDPRRPRPTTRSRIVTVLHRRGIRTQLAQRRTAHGSGLGRHPVGRRAHPGVAPSVSSLGRSLRAARLYPRSLSHPWMRPDLLVLSETRQSNFATCS